MMISQSTTNITNMEYTIIKVVPQMLTSQLSYIFNNNLWGNFRRMQTNKKRFIKELTTISQNKHVTSRRTKSKSPDIDHTSTLKNKRCNALERHHKRRVTK